MRTPSEPISPSERATPAPAMIWARLAVDPLAVPLARALVGVRMVTPNRVTFFAFACAVGAALAFLYGEFRLGGALFLLRYLADCVDGKLARFRGTSSQVGALLDISADVVGIHLCVAALTFRLASDGDLALGWALGMLATIGCYNFVLAHRKHLGTRLGVGDGGSTHVWNTRVPVLRHWVAFARRIDMAVLPWVLEVEITVLGLAPLLLPSTQVAHFVVLGTCAYVGITLVNLRRCWRLARALDAREAS